MGRRFLAGLLIFLLLGQSVAFSVLAQTTPPPAALGIPGILSKPGGGAATNLIVKYRPTALAATDEPSQGKEVEQRLKAETTGIEDVKPLVVLSKPTTKEQVAANRAKFPKRAKRVPADTRVPNLSVIKQVKVKQENAQSVLDQLHKNPGVEYAEVAETPKPTSLPNDPIYTSNRSSYGNADLDQWGLTKMGLNPTGSANSGWDVATGSSNVVVAVYGTGLDYTHPDLENNVWLNPGEFPSSKFPGLDSNGDGIITLAELKAYGPCPLADFNGDGKINLKDLITTNVNNCFYDGVDDDHDGYPDDFMGVSFSNGNMSDVFDYGETFLGHDTGMAGIIGAEGNNGKGMTGVNMKIRLMSIQYSDYATAILYAAAHGADVVNFSWSSHGAGLKDFVDYAYANGLMVVFSAENEAQPVNPDLSVSDHTVIVSATEPNDTFSSYSGRGDRVDFAAPGWTTVTMSTAVQSNGFFAYQPNQFLTKDKNGNPALVYIDYLNWQLKFGTYTGGNWSFETVDSGNFNGLYPSLDFDANNNPHIAYYDWANRQLKYATKTDGVWTKTTLAGADDQGYFTSLKIGTDDLPRIAFWDKTTLELKLATFDGNNWSMETVGSVGAYPGYGYHADDRGQVSLAIDSGGNPHVAFYKMDSLDLGYAVKSGGNWTVEYPDTGGDVGANASLALDSNDSPHIAYADISNLKVKYATKSGGSWATSTPSNSDYSAIWANSIAIDSQNHPQIVTSYYDYQPSVGYFQFNGSSWQVETVGRSQSVYMPKMILLASDVPFFEATSWNSKGLYQGRKDGGSWTMAAIDPDWGNPYVILSGTSISTAFVSGAAALVISAHPTWTIDQVYWALASSATDLGNPGHDQYFGWGRLNLKAAMDISTPLVDTASPSAVISSPAAGSFQLPHGSIDIVGTASDPNFTYYTLLWRQLGGDWNVLAWFNHTAQTNGTLATWDTSGLSDGSYDLRLEVHDWYNTTTYQENVYVGQDTVPPQVTLNTVNSPTNITFPVITGTATDDFAGVAAVQFQVDGTSGSWTDCSASDGNFDQISEAFSCQVVVALSDGTHRIYVRATDTLNNTTNDWDAASVVLTVDLTVPTISAVTVDVATAGATIAWHTSKTASSQVEYGVTSSYTAETTEKDTSPRLTVHTDIISGLLSCTTYHYQVKSRDAVGNIATSLDDTFLTTGCAGNSGVASETDATILSGSGGTMTNSNGGATLTLGVPVGFAGSDATFQIKRLSPGQVLAAVGVPTGTVAAGSHLYYLEALSGMSSLVSSFAHGVTLTMNYAASEVTQVDDVSAMRIYRWDGSSWHPLVCTVDTVARTITCTTTAFSVFGLFGPMAGATQPVVSGVSTEVAAGTSGGDRSNCLYGWVYCFMAGPDFKGQSAFITDPAAPGAMTFIEPHASGDNSFIKISLITNPDPAPWSAGFTTAGNVYQFQALNAHSGYPINKFDKPVTVVVPYDLGSNLASLKLAWINPETGEWEFVPNPVVVDGGKHTLATTVSAFSDFVVVSGQSVINQTVLGAQSQKVKIDGQDLFQNRIWPKACWLFWCW